MTEKAKTVIECYFLLLVFYFVDTLVIIVKLRILHLILLNSLFLQKFNFAYFKENLVG